jgi:hypothetical protein
MISVPATFSSNQSSSYAVEVDRVDRDGWYELLQQFDDASIYQTWSYGTARWGTKNLSHLVLKRDGEVCAIAQAAMVAIPFLKRGAAYIPWGPAWRRGGKAPEHQDKEQMIRALSEEYAHRRRLLLRVTPMESAGEDDGVKEGFERNGFRCTEKRYRTLLIDLRDPMNDVLKKASRRWRRSLKAAEAHGLEIISGTDDELFQAFMTLYGEMVERKHFNPAIDIEDFRVMQQDLPESLKMKIMLCKFKGRVVAALIASRIGRRGIGLLGATGTAGLKLGSFYLLNWRMMGWMQSQGALFYDFGGYSPDENPGTASFKEGLPGFDVTNLGQFEICRSPISAYLVKVGEQWKSRSAKRWTAAMRFLKTG